MSRHNPSITQTLPVPDRCIFPRPGRVLTYSRRNLWHFTDPSLPAYPPSFWTTPRKTSHVVLETQNLNQPLITFHVRAAPF